MLFELRLSPLSVILFVKNACVTKSDIQLLCGYDFCKHLFLYNTLARIVAPTDVIPSRFKYTSMHFFIHGPFNYNIHVSIIQLILMK
jgi:hypothetical protein